MSGKIIVGLGDVVEDKGVKRMVELVMGFCMLAGHGGNVVTRGILGERDWELFFYLRLTEWGRKGVYVCIRVKALGLGGYLGLGGISFN